MDKIFEAMRAYADQQDARVKILETRLAAAEAQLIEQKQLLNDSIRDAREQIEKLQKDLQQVSECLDNTRRHFEDTPKNPCPPETPEMTIEPAEEEVEIEFIYSDEPEEPQTSETPEQPVAHEAPAPEQPAAPEMPAAEEHPQAFSAQVGTPVDDIRKAISLGDRFLFVRELFGNSGEELQKAIEALNTLASFEEALAWTESHYNWDKETKAYELFVNVLRRRF